MFNYNQINPNTINYWLESEEDWVHSQTWISSGPHLPGDKIAVQIDDNRLLRDSVQYYKLIRVDQQPTVIEEIIIEGDVNNWTINLPNTTEAVYRFGVAFNFKEENTTLISVRTITVDNINAEITLDKTKYSHTETPTMTIWNHGLSELAFGTEYRYEKQVKGEWRSVRWSTTWILPLFKIGQGETYSVSLRHPTFSKGLFRVVKEVSIEPDYRIEGRNTTGVQWVESRDIFAEFEVTDSPLIKDEPILYLVFILPLLVFTILSQRKRACNNKQKNVEFVNV